jgi:IS5 family transposase
MLTIDDKQADLFEGWIPEKFLELPEELVFADKALDDPRVMEPFLKAAKFTGRPTTAIAAYLRLMYLKFRYQMSYEVLVKEVSDSYKWRRFCHLSLMGKMPDDKTLIKLTGRYGEAGVRAVFDAVVKRAVEAKVIRGRKMRVDTTVTESNIHHPTDTGLLSDGVRVITRTVKKIKEVVKLKTRFRSRVRAMKRRLIKLIKFLKGRKGKAKGAFRRAKEEMLALARKAWENAMKVFEEMKGGLALKEATEAGAVSAVVLKGELKRWLDLFKRVMDQTRTVLNGNVHIPGRLVSLFDEGARPIQKGKLFPKTEFGRKVLIQEAESGVVTGWQMHEGNPPDQTMLEDAIGRHEDVFGKAPRELAADRGFHLTGQDEGLRERGIEHVSIPVKGNKTDMRKRTERSAWFRRLQRWRAGGEAKLSLLKRKYGMRRTAVRGDVSTAAWIGWGLIAHNLVMLSRLGMGP